MFQSAQCTDHWTTGQNRSVGVPAVQLTTHLKSSTLYGRTVVWSYIQIFSTWWVTTILYNYGATLCELRYKKVQNISWVYSEISFTTDGKGYTSVNN